MTVAELGGRRAGRAVVQRQRPDGKWSFQSVARQETRAKRNATQITEKTRFYVFHKQNF